jgi:hypothetical protein
MPRPGGAASRAVSRTLRTPLTTATVEALPFFKTPSSTERRPSFRTMFCCTAHPSCTWPTSLRNTVCPLTYLIEMLAQSNYALEIVEFYKLLEKSKVRVSKCVSNRAT